MTLNRSCRAPLALAGLGGWMIFACNYPVFAKTPLPPPDARTEVSVKHRKTFTGSTAGKRRALSPKASRPAAAPKSAPEHFRISSRGASGGGGMIAASSRPYAVQSVTKEYINMRSPTSTPLDLVQQLPSLSVSAIDSSGTQGGQIYVRGLSSWDMALLWNGTAGMNASYIYEISDPENIETVSVTPGSSSIDLPASTAAAGVMNVKQIDPGGRPNGLMDFSYGTNNMSREFIRFGTGTIGNTGLASFFSFSHTHADSWIGAGPSDKKHIDFGLKKTWENGSWGKIYTTWNGQQSPIPNYPTAQQFKDYKHNGTGWGKDGSFNGLIFGTPGKPVNDNYYKAATNSFNQLFVSAPLHIAITRPLSFDLHPYMTLGRGWGGNGSGAYYNPSDGQPLYTRDGKQVPSGRLLIPSSRWDQNRVAGFTAAVNYKWNHHNRVTLGYWYENNISQGSPDDSAVALSTDRGGSLNPGGSNATYLKGPDGKLYRNVQNAYDNGYELNSFFLENQSHYLHNRLTVLAGFKYVMSNYWQYEKFLPWSPRTSRGMNPTAPLPQLSIGYKLNRHHQFYINAEGDFRQPQTGSIANTSSGSAPAAKIPKTQYSIKEEVGYRYNNQWFMIDASFFNYNITNRLSATYLGGGQYGTVNIGNQTSSGFDALIAGHSWHHFSPYASIEYLDARLDSHTPYGDSYLPNKGFQAPLAPHVLANFGISYTAPRLFGNFGMHYTGPQSVTLMNDQRIPGFITDNLNIGYHFPTIGFAQNPTLKLNFQNLTGAVLRTGTNGMTYNFKPVTLLNGKAVKCTSGAGFLTLPRFSMTGTVSVGF